MIKILFPCFTQPEMETILPIIQALPKESLFIIINDNKYKLNEIYKNLNDSRLRIIQIDDLGPDIRKFLTQEKISIICTAHYASYLSCLFVIAGKKIGIPSIYISHGIIYNNLISKETKKSHKFLYYIKNFIVRISGMIIVLRHILIDDKPIYLLKYIFRFICSGCIFEIIRIGPKQIWSGKYLFPFLTKVCITGPYYRDYFEKNGVPQKIIAITGQPRYDALVNKNFNFCTDKVYKELKLDSNKKIILYTTQPLNEIVEGPVIHDIMCLIINEVKKITDTQLVIKVHPREDAITYKQILNEMNILDIPVVKDDIPLNDLLCACDVMVTVSSTTALEAMILNKPVITINFNKTLSFEDFALSGAALGIYKVEDLVPTIRMVLYDTDARKTLYEKSNKFIYDHVFLQDGKASERVAKLIIKMNRVDNS